MEDLLPSSVFGLPLHPLVVHAAVILVPLTAVMVLLAAVVPTFRRWAGWLPLAAAAGCVVLTRVASDSGTNLQRLEAEEGTLTSLVAPHQALGEQLIWWVLGVLVVALAAYVVARRERAHDRAGGRTGTTSVVPRWATVGVAVAGVLVAAGTVVHTVRVGHSGAQSVWDEYTQS